MGRGFSFDDVIFRPGIVRLLHQARPAGGECVLDLAAGSGMAAGMAGEMVGETGRVMSLDIGRNILKKARRRYDGPAPAAWVRGDAIALPFQDAAFDLVLCHQGLQFFSDRLAAARELRRVTAPGGRAVMMTWAPLADCPFYAALETAIAEQVGRRAAGFVRQPFSLARKDELSAVLEGAFNRIEISRITIDIALPSPVSFATAFLSYVPPALTTGHDPERFVPRVADQVASILGSREALTTTIDAHIAICGKYLNPPGTFTCLQTGSP